MRCEKKILINFWLAFILISISSPISNIGGNSPSFFNTPGLFNSVSVDEPYGGYLQDDFSDLTDIDNYLNLDYGNNRFTIPYDYVESFESYSNGQNIEGTGGWVKHTTYNTGTFTADASSPFSPISSTIGKHICGDSTTSSVVQVTDFNMTKGIIQFWAAASYIFSTDHTSTQFTLLGSNDPDAPNTDRIIGLGFYRNGLTMYNGDFITLTTSISTDTWYRILIRFDCTTQRFSTAVFDKSNALLGSATDEEFWHSHSNVKGLQIVTGASSVRTHISYIDEIIMKEEYSVEENFEICEDGEDITDKFGWEKHDTYNTGDFLIDRTRSFNSLTPAVINFTCSDPSTSAIRQSPSFNIDSGTLQFWAATNYIYGNSFTSSQFALLGSDSDNAPNTDRIIGLGFNMGGFSVYNGIYHTLTKNVTTYTWYHIIIDFNCDIEKCDISIYSKDGKRLGETYNLSFWNSHSQVKRFQIITGNKALFTPFSTYFDDLLIMDNSEIPKVVSEEMTIPINSTLSTLKINKFQYGTSTIRFDIYYSNGSRIDGIHYENILEETKVDGFIDVNIIIIEVEFYPCFFNPPELNGWAIEWNESMVWTDTFITNKKLSWDLNIINSENTIIIEEGQNSGNIRSEEITIPTGYMWNSVELYAVQNPPSQYILSVIDPKTGLTIGEYSMANRNQMNISLIDPDTYPSLILRMDFSMSGTDGPELHWWAVRILKNERPELKNVEISENIFRGDTTILYVDCRDGQQNRSTLHVDISHSVGGLTWEDNYLSDVQYNSTLKMWTCNFTPTIDSSTGEYSFKVNVSDILGDFNEKEFENITTIMNNVPTVPQLSISPINPTTMDQITAIIEEQSVDVETEGLLYSFLWYIDDNLLSEYCIYNQSIETESTLPYEITKKNQVIKCELYSNDGNNYSNKDCRSVVIKNTPPFAVEGYENHIQIYEDDIDNEVLDLNVTFHDYDEDDILTFTITGNQNISIQIKNNSILTLTPEPDWFGTETITIIANDSEGWDSASIQLEVLPVNDPPEFTSIIVRGETITPLDGEVPTFFNSDGDPVSWIFGDYFEIDIFEDVPENITLNVEDIDQDDLTIGLFSGHYTYPLLFEKNDENNNVFTITSDENSYGEYWVNLTVDDQGVDGKIWTWIHLTVINVNDKPEIISIMFDEKVYNSKSGTVPKSFDNIGRPSDWENGNVIEIQILEDIDYNFSVNAEDIDPDDYISYFYEIGHEDYQIGILQDDNIFDVNQKSNKFGIYWIKIYIEDLKNEQDVVWIKLNSSNVNDPPFGSINISGKRIELLIGEKIFLSATVEDIDSEELTVKWRSDDIIIGNGLQIEYNWSSEGAYNLSAIVTDGEFEVLLGHNLINVSKVSPPISSNGEKEESNMIIYIAILVILFIIVIMIIILFFAIKKRKVVKVKEEADNIEDTTGIISDVDATGTTDNETVSQDNFIAPYNMDNPDIVNEEVMEHDIEETYPEYGQEGYEQQIPPINQNVTDQNFVQQEPSLESDVGSQNINIQDGTINRNKSIIDEGGVSEI